MIRFSVENPTFRHTTVTPPSPLPTTTIIIIITIIITIMMTITTMINIAIIPYKVSITTLF